MTKVTIPPDLHAQATADRDPAYLLECARAQADQLRRDLNATRETCAMWERRAREPQLRAQATETALPLATEKLESYAKETRITRWALLVLALTAIAGWAV